MPLHAAVVPRVSLDESFFRALASFREIVVTSPDSERWTAWQEAIYCFNQANTDNESMSEHLEWVLMSSALERILGAPGTATPWPSDLSKRSFRRSPNSTSTSRYFETGCANFTGSGAILLTDGFDREYRVDGSRGITCSFGAIAFPLLTKALLENEKSYVFTENDHCQLAALAWMLREALDASATAKSWRQYTSDQHLLIRRSPMAS